MLSSPPCLPPATLQWLIQAPLLIIASACGGLLGCAFNMLKRRSRFWRQRHPGIAWRLLECAAVALATATALIVLPAVAGTCLKVRWGLLLLYRAPYSLRVALALTQ